MEIFPDGRLYLSQGELCPFVCPQCEHIMAWYPGEDLITCEKCEARGARDEFSRGEWKLIARVN